jgi:hypothetical protein
MIRLPSEIRASLDGLRRALEDGLLVVADRADWKKIADAHREWIALLSRVVDAESVDEQAITNLETCASEMKTTGEQWTEDISTSKRLEKAAKHLAEATDKLRSRMPLRPLASGHEITPQAPFLASMGIPRAHSVDVPPPRILLRDDPERTRSQNLAEWSGTSTGDLAQLRAIARDCFEDIGSLGNLRRLYDHEPWWDAARFEQRLLDNLDAVVSLDIPLDSNGARLHLAEALYAYATEWTIPDYGRTFALAFTLCCLDSETAMRWVSLALRRSHPKTYPAYVDAFVLGSNPSIDRALAELCRSDEPALVEVALEAMTRRGSPDMASLVLVLMRPSAMLAPKALALATRLPGTSALPLLNRLVEHSNPLIAAHAAAALLVLGDARGAKQLRGILQQGRQDEPQAKSARQVAFEYLCLLGSPFDRSAVSVEANANLENIPWLGWHGHSDHLPTLIEAARRTARAGTFPECDRIVTGLERMCGPGAPRPGGFGPDEFDAQLTAYIKTFEEKRPLNAERLRLGAAWSPIAVVTELATRDTRQGIRPTLAQELALITRGTVHVDVADWTAQQNRVLAGARDAVFRQAERKD